MPMICVFLLLLFLSGCVGGSPSEPEKDPPSLEQQEAAESPSLPESSEGLICSPQSLKSSAFPPKLTLGYGGEPVPISENSQVLLVGLTLGPKPCALVEVNGKGRVLEAGDLLGKYRAVKIKENEMEFEYGR